MKIDNVDLLFSFTFIPTSLVGMKNRSLNSSDCEHFNTFLN